MTKRESFLLKIMVGTAVVAMGLWVAQSTLDELSGLDRRFIALQRQANQLQLRLVQKATAQPSTPLVASKKLWEKGQLPDPLTLARSIGPDLERHTIEVRDFQVVTSEPHQFWLKYSLKGPAATVLPTLKTLNDADPYLLSRRFSARIQEDHSYAYDWEVGYVSTP